MRRILRIHGHDLSNNHALTSMLSPHHKINYIYDNVLVSHSGILCHIWFTLLQFSSIFKFVTVLRTILSRFCVVYQESQQLFEVDNNFELVMLSAQNPNGGGFVDN